MERCGSTGPEYLYLTTDWEADSVGAEGQEGCHDGHNQTGTITCKEILLPKVIKDIKQLGEGAPG